MGIRFDIVQQMHVLATRRDAAGALRDHGEEVRAQALIDRIRTAFTDRRAFAALALWRAPHR